VAGCENKNEKQKRKTKTKNKNGTHWVPFLLIIHGERPVV
jgi:hypothetical protein